jgi:hypothetical protein
LVKLKGLGGGESTAQVILELSMRLTGGFRVPVTIQKKTRPAVKLDAQN